MIPVHKYESVNDDEILTDRHDGRPKFRKPPKKRTSVITIQVSIRGNRLDTRPGHRVLVVEVFARFQADEELTPFVKPDRGDGRQQKK